MRSGDGARTVNAPQRRNEIVDALRLLIGGSPCTYWSIAQTKGRETEPSGMGWELFLNFLIALEKYTPDYFLYENNKSMSKAIKAEISRRFGFDPVLINSSVVSAQNRQRFYWVGKRPNNGALPPCPGGAARRPGHPAPGHLGDRDRIGRKGLLSEGTVQPRSA